MGLLYISKVKKTPEKPGTFIRSTGMSSKRDQEMKRQRELIDGHLRDRHYYYAKPMLISFLKNFGDVDGWDLELKYYNYFLGIIDDLELARHEIKQHKEASTPKKKEKPKEKEK